MKHGKLSHIVTGTDLPDDDTSFLLNCIEKGEDMYQEYRRSRLVDRSKKLFDVISCQRTKTKKAVTEKPVDLNKVQADFVRVIDIARCRGYNVRNLLSYEITTTSYFLTTADGYLTKAAKFELLPLLRTRQIPIREYSFGNERTVSVIDFMAQARKIDSREKNTI